MSFNNLFSRRSTARGPLPATVVNAPLWGPAPSGLSPPRPRIAPDLLEKYGPVDSHDFLQPFEVIHPDTQRKSYVYKSQRRGPTYRGGFSDVFVGFDGEGTLVAIKRPKTGPSSSAPDVERRTLREKVNWVTLNHPNILPLIGTFREAYSLTNLVSPFMQNGTMMEYIQRNPQADRIPFIREISSALAHLAYNNIIHGDIRPDNMLISNDLSALLADFGLSKAFLVQSTSETQRGVGNTVIKSPELWQAGGSRTPASDVYAFGITIAQILVGRDPFWHVDSRNLKVFTDAVIGGERPLRPVDSPAFPPRYAAVWGVAEQCWRGDPAVRPTMPQVSQLLHQIV